MDIACNLLQAGQMTMQQIAKMTSLSLSEVQKLKAHMNA